MAERIRKAARAGRRSRYTLIVVALAVAGAVVVGVFPASRRTRPTLPSPRLPRPEFALLREIPMPAEGIDRMTVIALVRPGLTNDDLRLVMEWLIYDVLERSNRLGRERIQVVWTYVLEDSIRPVSEWRAMAIWVDPGLPNPRRPAAARIGGDAIRVGDVEYDFSNSAFLPGRSR
uniref:Uncharacterized protein n=1 Tax=candidate division WOR-3 bacterium TaxID=2052148 RepID=A0A7C4GCL7_UNCW3